MLLIYPDKLFDMGKIKAILDYLKYPYTYNINADYNIVFNSNINAKHKFDLKTDKYVINRHCTNVLKDWVDERWGNVYGYNLRINPLKWSGHCVMKPIGQGLNTGKIVKCPSHELDNHISLKLVDTRISADTLCDYRVFIMKGQIVLILLKKKHIYNVFSNEYRYELVKNIFTSKEKESILEFSSFLDFGEIDILRSNFDGRIYVVDVNNLPGYGYFRDNVWVKYISEQFMKIFL